jgi:hypothetical protein
MDLSSTLGGRIFRSWNYEEKLLSYRMARPLSGLNVNRDGRVESVLVPNVTEDGTFDEALPDMDFVVHVASPLARGNGRVTNEEYPDSAIGGTLSIEVHKESKEGTDI